MEYASKPSSKSCDLDPLPASAFKGCSSLLLLTITKIVNLSLSIGVMPNGMKVAELLPLLKKPDADYKLFPNLKMVLKMVEKAAALQMTNHVMTNHLDEMFQSANKAYHSTATALIKVQNNILCAIDNKSVLLLLLDLSAAFDTVDHSVLLLMFWQCPCLV